MASYRNSSINGTVDYGPEPYETNITQATMANSYYRTVIWTGRYLQVTLMSIPRGGEIGLEVHPDTDQFLRLESGCGRVYMGASADRLTEQKVGAGNAVLVPAGTWHNIVNTGSCPIKLYSIYAPPHHPHGTVHKTKADSDAEEHGY